MQRVPISLLLWRQRWQSAECARLIQKWLMPITLGTRQRVFLFISRATTREGRRHSADARWWDKFLLSLQMVSFRCHGVLTAQPHVKTQDRNFRPDDWCNYSGTDKTRGSINVIFFGVYFAACYTSVLKCAEMGPKISILATTMTRHNLFSACWEFDSWELQNSLFLMAANFY